MSDRESTTAPDDRWTPPAAFRDDLQATLPQTVEATGKVFQEQFAAFVAQVVSLADEFGKLAGRGSSFVLLTLGLLLILIALASNIQTVAEQIGVLATPEFIAVVIVGALLVFCGAAVRLYNNHVRHEREKELIRAGRQMLASLSGFGEITEKTLERQIERQMDRYRRQQEALLEIAKENQSRLQQLYVLQKPRGAGPTD